MRPADDISTLFNKLGANPPHRFSLDMAEVTNLIYLSLRARAKRWLA